MVIAAANVGAVCRYRLILREWAQSLTYRTCKAWIWLLDLRMIINVIQQSVTQRKVLRIHLIQRAVVLSVQPFRLVSNIVRFEPRLPRQFRLNTDVPVLDHRELFSFWQIVADILAIQQ